MVNLIMRMMGLGSAVDALDGATSKAYLGGLGQILTGLATLCGGLAGIVSQIVAAHGGSEYLSIAQGLSHNASAGLILAGAGLISKGLADIGNRHAIAKLDNFVGVPQEPDAPPPPPALEAPAHS